MIMGADMGTTITNTIVSLGNLRDRDAFVKSFQAATVHDFFNLYSIVIFLPLEMLFHPLESASQIMAGWFANGGGTSVQSVNVLSAVTKPLAEALVERLQSLPTALGAGIAIMAGIGLIMLSVVYLGKLLRRAMTGNAQRIVNFAIGRGPLTGIFSGTVVTVLVQSSSTTTSLVVPLAGAGVLTTRQVYPFTLGANIGTCITALLAATAITGENQIFALQIALAHLLYNVMGVAFFAILPWLWSLPVSSAMWLGRRVGEHRGWALAYLLAVFFVLPGSVFLAEYLLVEPESVIRSAAQSPQLMETQRELEEKQLEIE